MGAFKDKGSPGSSNLPPLHKIMARYNIWIFKLMRFPNLRSTWGILINLVLGKKKKCPAALPCCGSRKVKSVTLEGKKLTPKHPFFQRKRKKNLQTRFLTVQDGRFNLPTRWTVPPSSFCGCCAPLLRIPIFFVERATVAL